MTVGAHPEQGSPLKMSLEEQKGLSKLNNMGEKSSLGHQASVQLPSLQVQRQKSSKSPPRANPGPASALGHHCSVPVHGIPSFLQAVASRRELSSLEPVLPPGKGLPRTRAKEGHTTLSLIR